LINDVQEIEKASEKPEFSTVDISTLETTQLTHTPPNFRDILNLTLSIESGALAQQFKSQKQAQTAPAPQRTVAITAQQAKQTIQQQPVQISQPIQQQPQLVAQEQSEATSVKQEMEKFTSELAADANNSKPQINTFKVKIEGEDDLVLPKLSVVDQLSELEHIIEGINQHVFDEEHLNIIKEEVFGLKSEVSMEISQGTEREIGIDQMMIQLRDKRLNEAIALIVGVAR
jgi:hypothetical protein